MILFFLTFFLVYGSLHLYAFLKVRAAFSFGIQANIFLALFMVLMILAPIIVRFAERSGFELFARVFAYIGYTWMGILVLFIAASLVLDIYRFVFFAFGVIVKKDFSRFMIPHTYAVLIPLVLSLVVTVYGYFEARDIRTERVVIKTRKISAEIGTLKIVQISDVHLGLIIGEDRLKKILRIVKAENPDILISTGDLVDGQSDNMTRIAALLSEIKPRYGKFAITGNHEFYAGLAHSLQFMEKSGFTILRGERSAIAGIITIAGIDDPAGKRYNLYNNISEKKLLAGIPRDTFALLLKHRPVVDNGAIGLFDLQLSGHVHKGQIFPLSIITGFVYHTQEGLAHLSENSYLYVSRGTGTWGPPIRFLSPPEVTVIELVHPQDFT
jgi:predicted MPP superfamily phosphohydrolase